MWSYLLAAVGVLGIYRAGRETRPWVGWVIGLAAQVLWVVYALATSQYGFLVSAAAYGTVYALNVRRQLRRWDTPAAAAELPELPEPRRGAVLVHGQRWVVTSKGYSNGGAGDRSMTVHLVPEQQLRDQLAELQRTLGG